MVAHKRLGTDLVGWSAQASNSDGLERGGTGGNTLTDALSVFLGEAPL